MKLFEQIERRLTQEIGKRHPWSVLKNSHKKDKRQKHREERRRAKEDPECQSLYRRYKGWEW